MLPTPIQNQASNTAATGTDNQTNMVRQQKGTGFTNIDSILNANQGAGEKIGSALSSSLAGQANSVQAGIQAAQNQFNTNAGTANTNAQNSIQAGNQYVQGATSADSQGASDDYLNSLNDNNTNYTQIGQNLANASYTGPTGLSNADSLNQQASNVAALGRLANTSSGQSQLLRSQVANRGNYSTGDNALDSLLLGTSGQQALQSGVQAANSVQGAANNAVTNAQNQATAYTGAINNDKAATIANLQNSLTGDGTVGTDNTLGITGLETQATNAATAYKNNVSRLQQLLNGTDSSGNVISATGTTGDANSVLSDADKALLANMSQYGIANESLYNDPNNTGAINTALGNIGSQLNTNLGSMYYTGNSNQAAQNLAAILAGAGHGSDTDAATIASYGTGGANAFNTQAMSDTGNANALIAANNLSAGINSQISDQQSRAAALQSLLNSYNSNFVGLGLNNMQDIHDYLNSDQGARTNTSTGVSNDKQAINNQIFGLRNAFQQATGQNFDNVDDSASDKNIADILSQYYNQYNTGASSLQSQLASNSSSLQQAALARLLANASTNPTATSPVSSTVDSTPISS